MIKTNTIGATKEIYVEDNSWITESYPTYFHTFVKRKILTSEDSIDNYKEVTNSQKLALEESDSTWQSPPQSFIGMYNSACGIYGTYNENSGYFELNGLTDITYEQALNIMSRGQESIGPSAFSASNMDPKIRTNLPPKCLVTSIDCRNLAAYQTELEVLRLNDDIRAKPWLRYIEPTSMFSFLYSCTKLKK